MNNPNLTLVGTGDFSLIPNTSAVPASESDYDAATALFGNVKSITILNEQEIKKHFGSYRGTRILDRVETTQTEKGYRVTLDEIDDRFIKAFFYASQGSDLGTSPDFETFTPFGAPNPLVGMGRIRMWGPDSEVDPRFMHKDFYATVKAEGDFELGEDFTDFQLTVYVLSPVGTVYLRKLP